LSEKTSPETNPQDDAADIIDAEVIDDHGPEADTAADRMKTVVEPAPKKSGKGGWITAAVLAAFMGGVYATPYFEEGMISLGLRTPPPPPVGGNSDPVDLSPLSTDLENLRATTAALREAVAQQLAEINTQKEAQEKLRADLDLLAARGLTSGNEPRANADLSAIRSEMERLTTDVARLSALSTEADPALSQINGALALARTENAQLKERLTVLEAALKAVEAGSLEASPRGRLVLSLGRMKDKAMAGEAFGADLAGLRSDLATLPALDQQLMGAEIAVLDGAKDGVLPYVTLVRDYDPAVASAIRAGEKAEGGFLQGLFTARRTDGGASGNDAIFLQAERRLVARDVAGALDMLKTLEGPVKEGMAPWMDAAAKHVAVATAFDRLIRAASTGDNG